MPAQTRAESPSPTPPSLERFNTEPAEDIERTLLSCLHSLRWARRLTDHRPYPDLDSLLAAADEAAYDLTPGDLSEALAAEALPALPDGVYSAAHMALGAAHAAYESQIRTRVRHLPGRHPSRRGPRTRSWRHPVTSDERSGGGTGGRGRGTPRPGKRAAGECTQGRGAATLAAPPRGATNH